MEDDFFKHISSVLFLFQICIVLLRDEQYVTESDWIAF